MGGLALSSLYRREIERRVNDTICENAYCNISLMGGAGPGDDRKKSHHFRDLQQGKGALRHQESFPILVEATYLAPLAIFFFRDEFAAAAAEDERPLSVSSESRLSTHRATVNRGRGNRRAIEAVPIRSHHG